MENSKKILKQFGVIPLLRLAIKKEGGGVESTGPHKVKLIEDKIGKKIEYQTGKEIYVVWYFVEENGEKKKYPVPVKDKNDEVHYLIQRLSVFEPGDEVILECKREGQRNIIDVMPVKEKEPKKKEKETKSPADIKPEDIPVVEDEDYGEPPEDLFE